VPFAGFRFQTNTIMESFEAAVEGFRKFLIEHDYPPNLLWLTPDDIVFWGCVISFGRGTYQNAPLLPCKNTRGNGSKSQDNVSCRVQNGALVDLPDLRSRG
jgi:hypothetical protein